MVGGIFNSVNPSVYEMRKHPVPTKQAYMLKDLQDWDRAAGLQIVMPPKVFPVNSVKAMRGCVWLLQNKSPAANTLMTAFAKAVFEAYWTRDQDISQDAVLADICRSAQVDATAFFEAMGQCTIKYQLKANIEELMQRGGFGTPTIFLQKDMYFGNDRLELMRMAFYKKLAFAD